MTRSTIGEEKQTKTANENIEEINTQMDVINSTSEKSDDEVFFEASETSTPTPAVGKSRKRKRVIPSSPRRTRLRSRMSASEESISQVKI